MLRSAVLLLLLVLLLLHVFIYMVLNVCLRGARDWWFPASDWWFPVSAWPPLTDSVQPFARVDKSVLSSVLAVIGSAYISFIPQIQVQLVQLVTYIYMYGSRVWYYFVICNAYIRKWYVLWFRVYYILSFHRYMLPLKKTTETHM